MPRVCVCVCVFSLPPLLDPHPPHLFSCSFLRRAAAEAICAGRDSATGNVVLVHGQLIAGGVNLKVRSQDPTLSNAVMQAVSGAVA